MVKTPVKRHRCPRSATPFAKQVLRNSLAVVRACSKNGGHMISTPRLGRVDGALWVQSIGRLAVCCSRLQSGLCPGSVGASATCALSHLPLRLGAPTRPEALGPVGVNLFLRCCLTGGTWLVGFRGAVHGLDGQEEGHALFPCPRQAGPRGPESQIYCEGLAPTRTLTCARDACASQRRSGRETCENRCGRHPGCPGVRLWCLP